MDEDRTSNHWLVHSRPSLAKASQRSVKTLGARYVRRGWLPLAPVSHAVRFRTSWAAKDAS